MLFLKYRVPIIVILTGISIFLGFGLTKLTKENGVEALISTDNPDYIFFKQMEDEFGDTDQIVVGISFPETVYSTENISLIRELSSYLEDDENIEEEDITSISYIDNIDGIDQELIIEPLVPEDESITDEIVSVIKEKVRDNDMLRGKIVSHDEKSTVFIITVNTDISMNAELLEGTINRIKTKLSELETERPELGIYRSGMVSVKHITSEYMKKDLSQMFPIAILVVIVILLILLKSLSGVIMPLLVTLFSVIWTLGLKGWIGSPLTITETIMPVMLIAIGCADGVHIVSEFLTLRRTGDSVRKAVTITMKNLKTPVILTSITTSLGFFSLIAAPGVSIRNMGIFLGFGVITAMIFSLGFIPALLSFKKDKAVKTSKKTGSMDFSRIGEGIIKGRYLIILLSALLLAVSILGMINVTVETDQIMFLKETDKLRVDTEQIQKKLGGVNTLDIIFTGEEDDFKKPENLEFLEALQKYSEDKTLVSYSISLVDYIRKINYEFNDKDAAYNRIPYITELIEGEETQGSDIVSNLLLLYEMGGGDTIDKVVNSDYTMAKVSLRLLETSQVGIETLVDDLDNWISVNKPEELEYRYSSDYMRVVMGNLITSSQIRSFVSTLMAILVLLMIIFKSPVAGFLTSLPVIIAVCFNFGIMWLTGTTLNIGTSIIASVGMGVGIDYAIHFFQRYKSIYMKSGDNEQSIIDAINESSKPILTNAVAVGIGFLVLLFSNYYIIAGIGWITALSMATTALCALFVLPAYLAVFNPLKKKRGSINMKKGLIAVFVLLSGSLFGDANEIMLKNDQLKDAENSSNITTMVLINKSGKKKVRKMESYSIDTEIGEDSFVEFILPKDVKGTKFLTIGDDNGDDDQRIYLPALKKIRKISSSNKNGKFMGSDITYYDMESKNYNDYSYKMIGEETFNDMECWVIESTPLKDDSPYNKVINYVSKEDYYIYKREMFDKKDRHIKTITVVEVEVIDEVIIPVKRVVENHKEKHKTLLSVSDLKINSGVDKNKFTIQNLN